MARFHCREIPSVDCRETSSLSLLCRRGVRCDPYQAPFLNNTHQQTLVNEVSNFRNHQCGYRPIRRSASAFSSLDDSNPFSVVNNRRQQQHSPSRTSPSSSLVNVQRPIDYSTLHPQRFFHDNHSLSPSILTSSRRGFNSLEHRLPDTPNSRNYRSPPSVQRDHLTSWDSRSWMTKSTPSITGNERHKIDNDSIPPPRTFNPGWPLISIEDGVISSYQNDQLNSPSFSVANGIAFDPRGNSRAVKQDNDVDIYRCRKKHIYDASIVNLQSSFKMNSTRDIGNSNTEAATESAPPMLQTWVNLGLKLYRLLHHSCHETDASHTSPSCKTHGACFGGCLNKYCPSNPISVSMINHESRGELNRIYKYFGEDARGGLIKMVVTHILYQYLYYFPSLQKAFANHYV